ncbi:MAG: hypothetical protein RHS_4791 [Robinsoniella sp. RHS]|nr:MAG: hypothetical protein RHS_4791 [Robinsoniella sp. RHS]
MGACCSNFYGSRQGVVPSVLSLVGNEVVPMYVTYSDLFTFVIMLTSVITLVVTIKKKHKK